MVYKLVKPKSSLTKNCEINLTLLIYTIFVKVVKRDVMYTMWLLHSTFDTSSSFTITKSVFSGKKQKFL